MTREETYQFAEELKVRYPELESIEVTSSFNGYPRFLRMAIVGFKTYDDAEDFAQKEGGIVGSFHRRFGQSLWDVNYNIGGPYDMLHGAIEDDQCSVITPNSIDSLYDFIIDNIDIRNGNYCNFDQLKGDIAAMEELWECYKGLSDDEFIKRHGYDTWEVQDKWRMSYCEDSHQYIIGVELYIVE